MSSSDNPHNHESLYPTTTSLLERVIVPTPGILMIYMDMNLGSWRVSLTTWFVPKSREFHPTRIHYCDMSPTCRPLPMAAASEDAWVGLFIEPSPVSSPFDLGFFFSLSSEFCCFYQRSVFNFFLLWWILLGWGSSLQHSPSFCLPSPNLPNLPPMQSFLCL